MRRHTYFIASLIITILLPAALYSATATPTRAASVQTSPNAAPPPDVLKGPPLPQWVLDGKAKAQPLQQSMLRSSLPPKIDYSNFITLTRCQDGSGGCFLYAALHVIDILKEMEHPYTPDLSYRYAQYCYNDRHIDQKVVHTDYGSCPEAYLQSNYDGPNVPVPTAQDDFEAKRYRIEDTSEYITPTVNTLKSLLVTKGPIWACVNTMGGHCIAIVGYDDSQNAFKFINSWGDTWDDDGYGLIPYSKLSQIDYVTYFTNRPSERAGTTAAYSARIRIRHDDLRSELKVAVGVEGKQPMVIWDRPNRTGPPLDSNKDLDIDVPLPGYAGQCWPPSPTRLWYVQVSDGDSNGKAAVVKEFTLAKLMKDGAGKYITEVHRPHMGSFLIPDGASRKVYVGAKAPVTELTLKPSAQTIKPGGSVVLSGLLAAISYDTDGPPTVTPLVGKTIRISSVASSDDSVEQSQWEQIATATTDANGQYSVTVKPSATSTYVAAYTRASGQIIARSNQIIVNAGTQNKMPVHKPLAPILRPH